MKPLYKTTVTIWSAYDPSATVELEDLAREAQRGDAYCSSQLTKRVEHPETDPDWDGTDFFGEDEELGPCILTGAPGENPDDCTTHDHEQP